jgi:hypothetical protein
VCGVAHIKAASDQRDRAPSVLVDFARPSRIHDVTADRRIGRPVSAYRASWGPWLWRLREGDQCERETPEPSRCWRSVLRSSGQPLLWCVIAYVFGGHHCVIDPARPVVLVLGHGKRRSAHTVRPVSVFAPDVNRQPRGHSSVAVRSQQPEPSDPRLRSGAQIDLQVNLLAEQEMTLVLRMLRDLCAREDIAVPQGLTELLHEGDVEKVAATVARELPEQS